MENTKSSLGVEPQLTTTLAFVADTQAPMWVETLWLRSHNNRKATQLLFDDVAQRAPTAFFLLGDVVNLGYSSRQWKPIDIYLKNIAQKNIATYAILGNHEVMGRPAEGMRKFQQRFPHHKHTGYVIVTGSIAVVLVNSNFSSLRGKEIEEQTSWYKSTLENFDADASIQFIITGCHHSPFTNSRIVKPSKEVEEKFVTPYLASLKSVLFLSGHSHNFEHYKVQGKNFLVIGGGGGLRQPLKQGVGSLADLAPEYKPLFHYITITNTAAGLELISHHLKKDFSGFEEGLKLEIKNI